MHVASHACTKTVWRYQKITPPALTDARTEFPNNEHHVNTDVMTDGQLQRSIIFLMPSVHLRRGIKSKLDTAWANRRKSSIKTKIHIFDRFAVSVALTPMLQPTFMEKSKGSKVFFYRQTVKVGHQTGSSLIWILERTYFFLFDRPHDSYHNISSSSWLINIKKYIISIIIKLSHDVTYCFAS